MVEHQVWPDSCRMYGRRLLMIRRFWATCAITLGIWEGLAVGTGRVPTITETCRRTREHKLGAVAITAWWIGLGWHILKSKSAT